MSDGADELLNISRDLGRIADEALPKIVPIMSRGAVNVKKAMNADLAGSSSFWPAAGSVSYDKAMSGDGVEYEIGPDKDHGAGALATLHYFGANGGGGKGDLEGPLIAEGEVIAEKITELIDRFADGI